MSLVTNGHGNSLWNAISLCLVGSEQLHMTLLLLTVFVMVKHKQHCLQTLSGNQNGDIDEAYDSYLQAARNDCMPTADLHIEALSAV